MYLPVTPHTRQAQNIVLNLSDPCRQAAVMLKKTIWFNCWFIAAVEAICTGMPHVAPAYWNSPGAEQSVTIVFSHILKLWGYAYILLPCFMDNSSCHSQSVSIPVCFFSSSFTYRIRTNKLKCSRLLPPSCLSRPSGFTGALGTASHRMAIGRLHWKVSSSSERGLLSDNSNQSSLTALTGIMPHFLTLKEKTLKVWLFVNLNPKRYTLNCLGSQRRWLAGFLRSLLGSAPKWSSISGLKETLGWGKHLFPRVQDWMLKANNSDVSWQGPCILTIYSLGE